MDDLISRQAAIDAIEIHIRTAEEPYQLTEKERLINYGFDVALDCICNLPTAEPRLSEDDKEVIRIHLGAIKENLCNQHRCNEAREYEGIIERLNGLPAAEKKGRWIPQDHNYKHGNISTCLYFAPVCSECGNSGDFKMNYCPNCGARMEESE